MAKKNISNNNKALAVIGSNVSTTVYQMEEGSIDFSGFKSLRIPIVKPREMPTGAFVMGEIKSIEISKQKEFTSTLLIIEQSGGRECKFPVTAVIARALQPSPEDYVGRTILIRKTGEAAGKSGKKSTHLFDVAVRD